MCCNNSLAVLSSRRDFKRYHSRATLRNPDPSLTKKVDIASSTRYQGNRRTRRAQDAASSADSTFRFMNESCLVSDHVSRERTLARSRSEGTDPVIATVTV